MECLCVGHFAKAFLCDTFYPHYSPILRMRKLRYREVRVTHLVSGGARLCFGCSAGWPQSPCSYSWRCAALCVRPKHVWWEVSLAYGHSYMCNWKRVWKTTHRDSDSSCLLVEIWIFYFILRFSILWFSVMGLDAFEIRNNRNSRKV